MASRSFLDSMTGAIPSVLGTLLCVCSAVTAEGISGVTFSEDVFRWGVSGDNWCMTWAADGDIYTSLDDGCGWTDPCDRSKDFRNNGVFRISGGPEAGTLQAALLDGSPDYSNAGRPKRWNNDLQQLSWQWVDEDTGRKTTNKNWYAYGIVSIEGDVFQFISHCKAQWGWGWFDGCQLIWRPSGQVGWKRWNGTDANDADRWYAGQGGNQLLFRNELGFSFSFVTIAQFGQDYGENKDGYVYLFSPNGPEMPEQLNLVRVKKGDLLDRSKYEYFVRSLDDGEAEWRTNEICAKGVVHYFPESWGWYSWSPSVVWNEALGLFVMAAGATQRPGSGDPMESFVHYEAGALALLWAKHPWGPWHLFHYDESWIGDHPDNRLYEPQLSPKWIRDKGRTMYLVYSDARDRHRTNYKWNMQEMTLHIDPD